MTAEQLAVEDVEFWPLKTVLAKVGRSKSTIYRMIGDGEFPASHRYPGSDSVFWLSTEVRAWQAKQLEAIAAIVANAGIPKIDEMSLIG